MGRLGRRVLSILVGIWLLAIAAATVLFSYRILDALVASGSLTSVFIITAVLALVFSYLSYRLGTNRLLARIDAIPLSKAHAPTIHASLDHLTDRMEVSRPDLYVVQLGQPNAFAFGSHTLVVDRSLVRLLTPAELESILAHELAHFEGHDALIQTLATSLLRSVASLTLVMLVPLIMVFVVGCWGLSLLLGRPLRGSGSVGSGLRRVAIGLLMSLIVAPTAALRVYSRHREYAADNRAIAVVDDPLALARALGKIQRATNSNRGLFSWLLSDHEREPKRTPLERVFATHPPTDDRIKRVREAAKAQKTNLGPSRWHRIEIH